MKILNKRLYVFGLFTLLLNILTMAQDEILLNEDDMPGCTLDFEAERPWQTSIFKSEMSVHNRWIIPDGNYVSIEYVEFENVTDAIFGTCYEAHSYSHYSNMGFNGGIVYSDNSWIHLFRHNVLFQYKNFGISISTKVADNYQEEQPILSEISDKIISKIEGNIDSLIVAKENQLLKFRISDIQYESIIRDTKSLLKIKGYNEFNTINAGWVMQPNGDTITYGIRKQWCSDSSTLCINVAKHSNSDYAELAAANFISATHFFIPPIFNFKNEEEADNIIQIISNSEVSYRWWPNFNSVSIVGTYNNYSVSIYYHDYKGFDTAFYKSVIESLDFETDNTSIADINSTNLNIYPNPSAGSITIEKTNINLGNYTLEIYSTMGQLVYSAKVLFQANIHLNLSEFPNGVYFVRLDNGNGKLYKKIILQR